MLPDGVAVDSWGRDRVFVLESACNDHRNDFDNCNDVRNSNKFVVLNTSLAHARVDESF